MGHHRPTGSKRVNISKGVHGYIYRSYIDLDIYRSRYSIDVIITDLTASTMQKYGQLIKVNQLQVSINVNVMCFEITIVQENL